MAATALLRVLSALGSACLLPSPALAADGEGAGEHQLQAAFVYQFTNFVEWPSEGPAGEEFLISVVGETPLLPALEAVAKERTIHGRKVVVRGTDEAGQLRASSVVFLGSREEGVLRHVVESTRGSAVLIISYAEGFASKGAMINFFEENGRLRFEI